MQFFTQDLKPLLYVFMMKYLINICDTVLFGYRNIFKCCIFCICIALHIKLLMFDIQKKNCFLQKRCVFCICKDLQNGVTFFYYIQYK